MTDTMDASIIHPDQLVNRQNKWIVTVSIMLAATMATIDTSIINVAIPDIRASFGASLTEISWIATGYMIANVIMITVSGWLSDILGRRNYFLGCVTLFTIASFLCGISWSLNSLILFRVLQGIGGGALLPISLTMLFETFPKKEHTTAMSIYAMGATVGPAIGPVLGGWLTDNFGWEMIFFINVPIGILVIIMGLSFVKNYGLFEKAARFDATGFAFIALALGSLQFVLEEGQRHDWFKSESILFIAIFSAVCFMFFIATELIVDNPLIDLRMFVNRNFSSGMIIMFAIGFVLLSLIYLIPLYASTFLDYTAYQIGLLVLPRALAMLCGITAVGIISKFIDERLLIASGLLVTMLATFLLIHITKDAGYSNLVIPLIISGIGAPFAFIKLSTVSLSDLKKEYMANGSSMFNLMLLLGGSFGISILSTLLARREVFHFNAYTTQITPVSLAAQERYQQLTGYFFSRGSDLYTAGHQALGSLNGILHHEALLSAFCDDFWFMTVIISLSILSLLLMKKPDKDSEEAVVLH